MATQPTGQGVPVTITVVGDLLLLDGQIGLEGRSCPVATEGAGGSWVGGAARTPTDLAFVGQVQIGETSSQAVIWLEPSGD